MEFNFQRENFENAKKNKYRQLEHCEIFEKIIIVANFIEIKFDNQ